MPRDDRSYSQVMRAHADEKKFLRRVRHRAFHPDYDSPMLFRLMGYLVRLVIFGVLVSAILFVRNKIYFNGEGFSEGVQAALDTFLDGEDSTLEKVYWKSNQAVTHYEATGGPHAFFRKIELPRIAAQARWRELLMRDNWDLRAVELGNAVVHLKAGTNPVSGETGASNRRAKVQSGSWLTATPDFHRTRFGEIALHNASFFWGPHWTSEGDLTGVSGSAKRQLGDWALSLTKGVINQNWLKNLKIRPGSPLKVGIQDGQINLNCENLQLGEIGKVRLEGIVTLSETPDFNIQLNMKSVELTDLLSWEFHSSVSGLVDVKMTLSGSPNRSDGIIFEGELRAVETGRLRGVPILQTLAVVTPRTEMRHMPIRIGSTMKFKSRQGVLSVTDIAIKGGGAAVAGSSYKTDSGEELDFANISGHFTYTMDTSELDQALVLEDIKKRDETEEPELEDPNLGFDGEVTVRMPWELLGEDENYRAKYFTKDNEGYGRIVVRLDGPLEKLSEDQATEMDREWAELNARQQNPFQ